MKTSQTTSFRRKKANVNAPAPIARTTSDAQRILRWLRGDWKNKRRSEVASIEAGT